MITIKRIVGIMIVGLGLSVQGAAQGHNDGGPISITRIAVVVQGVETRVYPTSRSVSVVLDTPVDLRSNTSAIFTGPNAGRGPQNIRWSSDGLMSDFGAARNDDIAWTPTQVRLTTITLSVDGVRVSFAVDVVAPPPPVEPWGAWSWGGPKAGQGEYGEQIVGITHGHHTPDAARAAAITACISAGGVRNDCRFNRDDFQEQCYGVGHGRTISNLGETFVLYSSGGSTIPAVEAGVLALCASEPGASCAVDASICRQ